MNPVIVGFVYLQALKKQESSMVKKTIGVGDDWETEMLKWSKEDIIKFLIEISKEKMELEIKLDLKSREQ